MNPDTHSARVEVKGLRADQIEIVEIHAEAIEQATGAKANVIDTTEGGR